MTELSVRPPTDLEISILGFILHRGGCTSYAVLNDFQKAPAKHFRKSAGAVYPAVSRLTTAGYIEAVEDFQGKRRRTLLTVTPAGIDAIREWMMSVDVLSAAGQDPVRTRILFLESLPREEQLDWLAQMRAAIQGRLDGVPQTAEHFGKVFANWHYTMELVEGQLKVSLDILDRIEADIRTCT